MKNAILMLSLLSLLCTGCDNCAYEFNYQPPKSMNDGLDVGVLKRVNIDTATIAEAVNKLHCGKFGEVHSVLIYKDKLLVLEKYFQGHKFQWDAPDYYGELITWNQDMLKLGVTYLNGGEWNGEKIISSEWVENSSRPYMNNKNINIPIEDSGKNGYAYSWWTSEFSYSGNKIKMFRAGGWGGQSIMVFPDLDMVVVFTGGNYAAKSSLYEIIEQFVLPAIEYRS